MPFPIHPDAQARWNMLTHVVASQANQATTEPNPTVRRGDLPPAASTGSQAKPAGR